jgi:hypothetical protein
MVQQSHSIATTVLRTPKQEQPNQTKQSTSEKKPQKVSKKVSFAPSPIQTPASEAKKNEKKFYDYLNICLKLIVNQETRDKAIAALTKAKPYLSKPLVNKKLAENIFNAKIMSYINVGYINDTKINK